MNTFPIYHLLGCWVIGPFVIFKSSAKVQLFFDIGKFCVIFSVNSPFPSIHQSIIPSYIPLLFLMFFRAKRVFVRQQSGSFFRTGSQAGRDWSGSWLTSQAMTARIQVVQTVLPRFRLTKNTIHRPIFGDPRPLWRYPSN